MADTTASKSQTSNKKERLNGGHELDAVGDGGGDGEAWSTLSKAFKQVQAVLDQNWDLIQKVNENHRSKIPDNLVKNVALIGEINGNISKVHKTRQGAELRARHTSAAELRANRTSALRRGCMTATIGTPLSDRLSVSEHPSSRNLLRQNAPCAFNAVAPLGTNLGILQDHLEQDQLEVGPQGYSATTQGAGDIF
ncbi:hypothetical protein SLEP1_g6962 [Rubroshorea leprosula]|uniref:Protein EARLY FLOWERING 4 domain-containing protein n=1 Tax=Rubroshorea leprosula TaxID=152421 RepID=A0AAV5I4Z1_9ROSI|nr:hypothetical protein SLEP1_g6962 [Rubroshorea leprosula]